MLLFFGLWNKGGCCCQGSVADVAGARAVSCPVQAGSSMVLVVVKNIFKTAKCYTWLNCSEVVWLTPSFCRSWSSLNYACFELRNCLSLSVLREKYLVWSEHASMTENPSSCLSHAVVNHFTLNCVPHFSSEFIWICLASDFKHWSLLGGWKTFYHLKYMVREETSTW